jgi:hypothetical protein
MQEMELTSRFRKISLHILNHLLRLAGVVSGKIHLAIVLVEDPN